MTVTNDAVHSVADAIRTVSDCLTVTDSDDATATITDGLFAIADSINNLTTAIERVFGLGPEKRTES